MPNDMFGKDRQEKPGDSQQRQRPSQDNTLGIGPNNFQDVFSFHRHVGGPADGGQLNGPYFIRDSAGKNWKLVVSTTGVISAVKA